MTRHRTTTPVATRAVVVHNDDVGTTDTRWETKPTSVRGSQDSSELDGGVECGLAVGSGGGSDVVVSPGLAHGLPARIPIHLSVCRGPGWNASAPASGVLEAKPAPTTVEGL